MVPPGDRAGVGGGGRARQPVVRAVGGPALLRRSPDPVPRATVSRALGQVHPARLRARPRGRAPGADGRHDLPSGAQSQPGRAQEHPALGQRRPPAADRPATLDRLVLQLPEHHGRPLPPQRKATGDAPRPAGARPEPAGAVRSNLGQRPPRVQPRLWGRGGARGRSRPGGPAEVPDLGVRGRARADAGGPATHLLRRPAPHGAPLGHRGDRSAPRSRSRCRGTRPSRATTTTEAAASPFRIASGGRRSRSASASSTCCCRRRSPATRA